MLLGIFSVMGDTTPIPNQWLHQVSVRIDSLSDQLRKLNFTILYYQSVVELLDSFVNT